MLLKFWMSQTTLVMALMLTFAMAAVALFLCWLSFASRFAAYAQNWKGVVPPFVAVPATLFGLLMTFLSQDVWDANRSAYRAIAMEREQLATLAALSGNHGLNADDIPRAVRDYVETAVGLEWKTMEDGKELPETEAALNRLTRAVASARIERGLPARARRYGDAFAIGAGTTTRDCGGLSRRSQMGGGDHHRLHHANRPCHRASRPPEASASRAGDFRFGGDRPDIAGRIRGRALFAAQCGEFRAACATAGALSAKVTGPPL